MAKWLRSAGFDEPVDDIGRYHPRMSALGRTIRIARRRLLFADLVRQGGICACVAAAAGLAFTLLVRLAPGQLLPESLGSFPTWGVVLAALAGLAGLGAAVLAMRRHATPLAAAERLDRVLGLRDRLSTGVTIERDMGGSTDPFARAALGDAELAATRVRVATAVPIEFNRAWQVWPPLAALAILAGLFVPPWSSAMSGKGLASATHAQREQAAKEFREAIDALRQIEPAPDGHAAPGQTSAESRQLEELRQIEQELVDHGIEPREATGRAVSALESLAREREASAREQLRSAEAVQRALSESGSAASDGRVNAQSTSADGASLPDSNAESSSSSGQVPQSELARALRSGDLATASAAADRLLNRDTPEAERRIAADELTRLADDLDRLERAKSAPESSPSDPREVEATPPSSAPQEVAPSRSTELERDRPSPGSPRTENPESDARSAAARDLSQRLRQAAEAIRQPSERSTAPADQPEAPNQPPTADNPPDDSKPGAATRDAAASSPPREASPASPNSGGSRDQQSPERPAGQRPGGARTPQRPAQPTEPQPRNAAPDQAAESIDTKSASTPSDQAKSQPQDGAQSKPAPSKNADSKPASDPSAGVREPSDATQQRAKIDPQGSQEVREPDQTPSSSADRRSQSTTPNADEQQRNGETGRRSESARSSQATERTTTSGSGDKPQQQDRNVDPQVGERPSSGQNDQQPTSRPSSNLESPPDRSAQPPDSTPANTPGAPRTLQQPPASTPADIQPDPTNTPSSPATKPAPTAHPDERGGGDQDKLPEGPLPDLPKPNEGAVKELARTLERLANAPRTADQQRRSAEDLRRRAQEIAERMSPEQRERAREWAEALAREMKPSDDTGAGDRARPRSDARDDAQQPSASPEREAGEASGPAPDRRPDQLLNRNEPDSRRSGPQTPGDRSDSESPNESSSQGLVRQGDRNGQTTTPRGAEDGRRALNDPSGSAGSRSPTAAEQHGSGASSQPGSSSAAINLSDRRRGPTTRTELVDARPSDRTSNESGRIAAEWLAPARPGETSVGNELSRTLQDASRAAERAVEDRTTNRRFDGLLERYFRRLPERLKATSPQDPSSVNPPPAPAKDAP